MLNYSLYDSDMDFPLSEEYHTPLEPSGPSHGNRTNIIGAIVLILLFVFFGRLIMAKDAPPVDDSPLHLTLQAIPREDNAFYDLENLYVDPADAEERLHLMQQDTLDASRVASLLNQYQSEINAFMVASTKPAYQDPLSQDPDNLRWDTPITQVGTVRSVGRLLLLRAKQAALTDKAQAYQDVESVVKVGHMMATSQGILIQYLVGLDLLSEGFSSAKQLGLDMSALKGYAETSQGAHDAIATEYLIGRTSFEDALTYSYLPHNLANTSPPFKNFYYQPNRTKQIFFERMNADAKLAASDCDLIIPEPGPTKKPSLITFYLKENYLGNSMLWVRADQSIATNTKEKRCQIERLAT